MYILNKIKFGKPLNLIEQKHIIEHLEHLSANDKATFLKQLDTIDTKLLKEQIQSISTDKPSMQKKDIQPFDNFTNLDNNNDEDLGEELIRSGKVICLLIAGGQGTRLGFSGPKGMFPITRIRNKSLFQFFSERVIAASIKYDRKLPLAIMTSDANHSETLNFFQKNNYFGLSKSQIGFFKQDSLPMLTKEGNLILSSPTSLAKGPDGNGKAIFKLFESEETTHLLKDDPSIVNVVLIDNPLADPYDAKLIGHHHKNTNCVTIKCTKKSHPNEKVGVLGLYQNKPCVFEYSELPESIAQGESSGYDLANLSLFCFSKDFIKKLEPAQKKLPLHLAWKKAPFLSKTGETLTPETPNAWKFEYFIFDVLPYATRYSALVYPRSACFAPLKNKEGKDSIETLQESLWNYDLNVLEKVTGLSIKKINLEISPRFYYPNADLLKKWKGKELPPDKAYIDP